MPVLTENKKTGGIISPPRWPNEYSGGDGSGESGSNFPLSRAQLGMFGLLAAATMLFAGLTSAYLVLRGVPTWENLALPPLLWVNTVVLIASSLSLEFSRRSVERGKLAEMKRWLVFSGLLGAGFLAGQLIVWRQLVHAGVYLPTTLHSSFFYVLTAIHGVHLVGGLGGLAFVLQKTFKGRIGPGQYEPLKLCALYWHFMDAVWIWLFLLLFFV